MSDLKLERRSVNKLLTIESSKNGTVYGKAARHVSKQTLMQAVQMG